MVCVLMLSRTVSSGCCLGFHSLICQFFLWWCFNMCLNLSILAASLSFLAARCTTLQFWSTLPGHSKGSGAFIIAGSMADCNNDQCNMSFTATVRPSTPKAAHSAQTRGQSNLTKSASRGLIPRLVVTPGGRKLYHWIPGVGFPISVP